MSPKLYLHALFCFFLFTLFLLFTFHRDRYHLVISKADPWSSSCAVCWRSKDMGKASGGCHSTFRNTIVCIFIIKAICLSTWTVAMTTDRLKGKSALKNNQIAFWTCNWPEKGSPGVNIAGRFNTGCCLEWSIVWLTKDFVAFLR